MPDVAVRRARPEELAAVGDLTVAAYAADGYTTPGYVEVLRDAAARAAAGDLYVAVDTGTRRLLGTAAVFTPEAGPEWAEQAEPGDAVLRMLAVDPDARGRGAGAALAAHCVARARELGCRRVVLSTQPSMHAAHRIYERLGFRRDPGRDWEPVPEVSLLGYVLDL